MSTHCEMKVWSVGQLVNLYESKNINKPRIQRMKVWTDIEDNKFIDFMISHKTIVMPLLINEEFISSKRVFQVIDGNNRCNAIINFILHPLKYKKEWIPIEFSETLINNLQTYSLKRLLSYRYLSKLCKDMNISYDINSEHDELFGKLLDKLSNINFMEITIPVSVFTNLDFIELCNIYEQVNINGKHLTKQEILACTTSHILYTSSEIKDFNNINIEINKYYNNMITNEVLAVTDSVTDALNLFEILLGFQIYLTNKYIFIPDNCDKKENELDFIFRLYELEYGDDFKTKQSSLNEFLIDCYDYINEINNIINKFYNSSINYSKIKKLTDKKIPKNILILLFMYWRVNKTDNNTKQNIKQILLYHTLFTMIDSKSDKLKIEYFKQFDSIQYTAVGSYIPNLVKKLKENKTFDTIPTVNNIKEILSYVIQTHIKNINIKNKVRPPYSSFKLLMLSSFHDICVPRALEQDVKNIDHIVPYSTNYNEFSIDIDRLGNLQLIDDVSNKSRGKRPITNAYIDKFNLRYQHYPTETEYNIITDGIKILNIDAFNTMCDKREQYYMESLLKNIL